MRVRIREVWCIIGCCTVNGRCLPVCPTSTQESLSDYCWYLTEDGVVGTHRREALNRGLSLAKQVMRTLTEYIQVGGAAKNTVG